MYLTGYMLTLSCNKSPVLSYCMYVCTYVRPCAPCSIIVSFRNTWANMFEKHFRTGLNGQTMMTIIKVSGQGRAHLWLEMHKTFLVPILLLVTSCSEVFLLMHLFCDA